MLSKTYIRNDECIACDFRTMDRLFADFREILKELMMNMRHAMKFMPRLVASYQRIERQSPKSPNRNCRVERHSPKSPKPNRYSSFSIR